MTTHLRSPMVLACLALALALATVAPLGAQPQPAILPPAPQAPSVGPAEGPPPPPPAPLSLPASPRRFEFKIDPKTPLDDLLPTPPKTQSKLPRWDNEDLAKVPEVTFGERMSRKSSPEKAIEATAHQLAKASHLNERKTDGFVLALVEQRADLHGLPFLMGDDCKMNEEQARLFKVMAEAIQSGLAEAKKTEDGLTLENTAKLWEGLATLMVMQQNELPEGVRLSNQTREYLNQAVTAALVQILMPESESIRVGLAKSLAMIPHRDSTRALSKLAIFSPEDSVRAAAIEGLKTRRERDYSDILLHGFRYPLPAVARRAAEALVKLERKDLLANLVEVLERPDPRLPVTEKRDGKSVKIVRELVRVNHHHNCMLCHSPGNTEDVPEGVLTVEVPRPSEPLSKPSEGGYRRGREVSPDLTVRIDTTYLRQDFSVKMRVADAHPWPEMQRFDFLVRTRTLTDEEAKAYEPNHDDDEPGRLSPYHRSALFALRELTGRDTEPSAAAWRNMLKLPARP